MAGLPFRVIAIPGLVEGGYPGRAAARPLPARRLARSGDPRGARAAAAGDARRAPAERQLSLFDARRAAGAGAPARRTRSLATVDDRVARGAAAVPSRGRAGHGAADPLLPARRRRAPAASGCRRCSSSPPPPRWRAGRCPASSSDALVSRGRPGRDRRRRRARRRGARPHPRAARRRARRRWPSPPARRSSSRSHLASRGALVERELTAYDGLVLPAAGRRSPRGSIP